MAKSEEITLDCPVAYTLSVLGGKWKWLIIYLLCEQGTLRYGELKRRLSGITHKMLSQQLKELETEQLIARKEYHQIPPKVEYSLTEKGQTLIPILDLMCDWGEMNWPKANLSLE
ncbi:Hypothetical protein LUCI_0178 [Lucifera butyrica]|uniref:HTH hxlR-type domain-containing protein n=1 Tax=Lucifera butyrica TaxID=1351585 RepID=A0A498R3X1_9FIRM|nr:helix-turn-helix domain-containing protein [Lucifera butyrica]VBB04972.1 Hypothetical protein LUCI_0178 [Lucifera butyrica]